MQPLGNTLQVSPWPLAQRFAPAVQALVQVWQTPLLQVDIVGHWLVTQVLQPMAVSSWQTWRVLLAAQTAALTVHTSLQQVAVLSAI